MWYSLADWVKQPPISIDDPKSYHVLYPNIDVETMKNGYTALEVRKFLASNKLPDCFPAPVCEMMPSGRSMVFHTLEQYEARKAEMNRFKPAMKGKPEVVEVRCAFLILFYAHTFDT